MAGSVSSGVFGSGLVLLFVVYLVVIAGSLVMLIVALVDIIKRPDWQWKLAGQEKVLWILLVILLNVLAIPALIYWFVIRKKLMAVEQAAASGQLGPGHWTYGGWEPAPAGRPYPGLPSPGWYSDPGGQYRLRWWDGVRWSEHTRDGESPASPM